MVYARYLKVGTKADDASQAKFWVFSLGVDESPRIDLRQP